jgi:hypothetical protein
LEGVKLAVMEKKRTGLRAFDLSGLDDKIDVRLDQMINSSDWGELVRFYWLWVLNDPHERQRRPN